MADSQEWETTDVLICGCGPTGAMLSGYLGKLGVRNIILEREADITTDPRGIALDDDGIRYVQGLGLYEHVFTKIGSSTGTETLISICMTVLIFYLHRYIQRPFRCWESQ